LGHPHRDAPTDAAPALGDVVGWFKTMTTNEYIRGVKTLGWPPFCRRVWQRNYYEHIIRSGPELDAIRDYIAMNPLRWALDAENPLTRKPAVSGMLWQR
jgi:putative transposase